MIRGFLYLFLVIGLGIPTLAIATTFNQDDALAALDDLENNSGLTPHAYNPILSSTYYPDSTTYFREEGTCPVVQDWHYPTPPTVACISGTEVTTFKIEIWEHNFCNTQDEDRITSSKVVTKTYKYDGASC